MIEFIEVPVETLQEISWSRVGDKSPDDDYVLISDEIEDTSRWSVNYRMVFSCGNKYYEARHREPATEMQDDENVWGYNDPVICPQVFPKEITTTIYVRDPYV